MARVVAYARRELGEDRGGHEVRRPVQNEADRPVLIVLHADLLQRPSGTWEYMYAATFEWTPEEFEALRRATREVALFNSAYEDERYRVLELVQR